MFQVQITCTECKLEGDHFKLCIPILLKYFNVSVPYLNGAEIQFTFTYKNGKRVTHDFNCGLHYLDYLNKESESLFYVMNSEELLPLFEKSGLDYDFFCYYFISRTPLYSCD